MMNQRILYLVGFIISSFVGLKFYQSTFDSFITKEKGEFVTVEIIENPICGRNNKVQVLHMGKEYSVQVSKNKCIEGKYHIGDSVDMIYYKPLDHFILPYNNVKLGYYLSIFFFVLPIYFLFELIRPFKKR